MRMMLLLIRKVIKYSKLPLIINNKSSKIFKNYSNYYNEKY